MTDTGYGNPAGPAAAPATNRLWIGIDQWDASGGYSYCDGSTDRTWRVELIP